MILKINDKYVLEEAIEVLKNGGVVMHPTETCYGLAVDVRNSAAIEKLYCLKGRDAAKPVSILVADLEMAKKYGEFSEKALRLAEKYWPGSLTPSDTRLSLGPLTIIVPKLNDKGLAENFNPGQEFIGIRCSDHEFSRELVRAFGSPITTTSANLSGEPPLYEANVKIFGDLEKEIDLVVDGGKIKENKPSTIVKVERDEVTIVRQGELFLDLAG